MATMRANLSYLLNNLLKLKQKIMLHIMMVLLKNETTDLETVKKQSLTIIFCIFLFLQTGATARASDKILHLGILALRPKPQMQQSWQPFADYLSKQLPGYRVQLHLIDHHEMLAALEQQKLDFVLTNPSHYIILRQKIGFSGSLATMTPKEGSRPLSSFGGVIFTQSSRNDIRKLSDISDKRIACIGSEPGTFGGYQMQLMELLRAGIGLKPQQLLKTGMPQDLVIKAVLERKADVGFVRTGLIEQLERQGKIPVGSLTVINRQRIPDFPFASSTRLYPEWPFVALPHVDSRLTARVTATLLLMEPGSPALDAAGIHGFSIPADYLPVENLLRELRLPPFDSVPPFSIKDIWKHYRIWIISLALAIAIGIQRHLHQLSAKRRLKIALTKLEQQQSKLQNAKKATEAANQSMRLLSASNQTLLRSTNEEELLFQICRIAVEVGGYSTAWVGLALNDDKKSILPLAWYGIEDDFLDGICMSWNKGETGATAMATAIRTGTVQIRQDIFNNPTLAPLYIHAHKYNFQSSIALPLEVDGTVIGALAIYATEPYAFQETEVTLLEEMARDLAFGMQTIRDRQTHKKTQEHVHQLAYYDRLTGLPNRSLFQDRLQQAVQESSQNKDNLGVIFLDLDGFKEVNDTLGHDVGDELLKMIATRLSNTLRPRDTTSRFGGDEFAILASEIRKEIDLAVIARKLLTALNEPVTIQGRELHVTASIGIASFPSDSLEASDLLRYADAAMNHAKGSGKNSFKFYSASLTQTATERLELESDLRKALANGQLEVYYQPKIHTIIGQMTGAEALLRWHHPSRGMVPPDKFISIAEDTGLIVEIGAWVLHTACATATAWNKNSLFPIKVAVNLSARQLLYGDFADTVSTTLTNTGCRPEWLELEITENLLMSRTNETVSSLETLDKLGVSIALDDFGTGYSSLSYLTEFPIKTIKIDKAFIRNITTDKRKQELVRAIITLGRSLTAELVAEGVETSEQAACIDRLGCYIIQGYLYGRPMPVSGFNEWQNSFSATQVANDDAMARTISSAWRDYLTTNHPVIDIQHQELFRQITNLTDACRHHDEQHKVAGLLDYLDNYVKIHFATEEKLLLSIGSPDYFVHKAAHDYFADLVHTLISQCRNEGESRELTIKTNYITVEWLTRHICIMDRKLAEQLQEAHTES